MRRRCPRPRKYVTYYAILEAELRGISDQVSAFPHECGIVQDAPWFCDLTTSPDGKPVSAAERIAEIKQRYGPGHIVTTFITDASPELLGAVERTKSGSRENRALPRPCGRVPVTAAVLDMQPAGCIS